MPIQVGLDPDLPVPLTCLINASDELEVKYGNDSLTHPDPQELVVDVYEDTTATFQTSDFYVGSVQHTVAATTVDGAAWDDGGSTIVSEELPGVLETGILHYVDVTATNTSNNQSKTVRIRIRIREETIRPLP